MNFSRRQDGVLRLAQKENTQTTSFVPASCTKDVEITARIVSFAVLWPVPGVGFADPIASPASDIGS